MVDFLSVSILENKIAKEASQVNVCRSNRFCFVIVLCMFRKLYWYTWKFPCLQKLNSCLCVQVLISRNKKKKLILVSTDFGCLLFLYLYKCVKYIKFFRNKFTVFFFVWIIYSCLCFVTLERVIVIDRRDLYDNSIQNCLYTIHREMEAKTWKAKKRLKQ